MVLRLAPALLLVLGGCGAHAARHPPTTTQPRTAPPASIAVPSTRPASPTADVGFHVSESGGLLAFSRRRPAGGFDLVLQRGTGRPRRATGVRPSPVPFDVDIGTVADGHLVAVYTRAGVPTLWSPRTGRERPLSALVDHTARATWPSIDRGHVTFTRVGADGIARNRASVWSAATPDAPPRRIAQVPADGTGAVLGLQAGPRGVAVSTFRNEGGGHGTFTMWLVRLGHPPRAVGFGGTGEEHAEQLTGPTFIRGSLLWAQANLSIGEDASRSYVIRYDLRRRTTEAAPAPGLLATLTATPSGDLVGAREAPGHEDDFDVPRHQRLLRLRSGRLRFAPRHAG